MHFVCGKAQTSPCPMCTCWAGGQSSGASVLLRAKDGSLRHSYAMCAHLGEAGLRGMDLFNPLWHYFDLLPKGRGHFVPRKSYAPDAG